MSDDGNPSLADLMNFMKNNEEARKTDKKNFEENLKKEREKDKNDFTKDISNLTTTLTALVQTGLKDGMEAAVKPLEEKQKAMMDEQTKLVKKVCELEMRLESVTNDKTDKPVDNNGIDDNITESNEHTEPSVNDDETEARKQAIDRAKMILGFSKITAAHIKQAITEHDLDETDEMKAKVYAIYDFLYYEMKIKLKR